MPYSHALAVYIGHQRHIFQHRLGQPFCLHPKHFLYFNQVIEKLLKISLMWGRFPEGGNGTRKKNSTAKSPGLLPRLAM